MDFANKEFTHISKKKPSYKLHEGFCDYLKQYSRYSSFDLQYSDLLRYSNAFPVYDQDDNDTLWRSVIYSPGEQDHINRELLNIYVFLTGDLYQVNTEHLAIDRIDYCLFGNSNPFRIKVKNLLNDNHDYYYIKKADASRVFGLELEELLSPNKINFLVNRNTLIEEHILGIPGDYFLEHNLKKEKHNEVRLAKEFVKVNERSFIRLLGDMRAYNFVIDMTPDFDQMQYRVRAIDFDQQSYEGKKNMYLPQFFKENYPFVKMALSKLGRDSITQYQNEERSLIRRRISIARPQLRELLIIMRQSLLSSEEKINQLKYELSIHHQDKGFLQSKTMGDILIRQLNRMLDMKLTLD